MSESEAAKALREVLIPAHRKALKRIAKGDVLVTVHESVAPRAVIEQRSGGHVLVNGVSEPALRELRSRGLVEWDGDARSGTFPLRLTDAGRAALTVPVKIVREYPGDHPEHRRPRVASYEGEAGEIHVHINREDGALWLFILGPAGGERGRLAVHPDHRQRVAAFLDSDMADTLWGNAHGFSMAPTGSTDGSREAWLQRGFTRPWRMRFDAAAAEDFKDCLRAWLESAGGR